ncbi:MAG: hypothetical protein J6K32_10495 [Clostridia bacterium]|nr:hypothetical protein [Clostridia bacterium]
MTYEERVQDLFSVDDSYCLAHCISADFNMGKGIVTEFDRRFGIGAQLRAAQPGYAAHFRESGMTHDCIRTGRVFNLVTKERYSCRPTYASLRGALESMRDQCLESGVTKIAMPVIGCGLDRLKWEKVRAMIGEVFASAPVEILICIRGE